MISFLTICYMCICAYYTIFHVRVLNYYYLAPNHQSDEYVYSKSVHVHFAMKSFQVYIALFWCPPVQAYTSPMS